MNLIWQLVIRLKRGFCVYKHILDYRNLQSVVTVCLLGISLSSESSSLDPAPTKPNLEYGQTCHAVLYNLGNSCGWVGNNLSSADPFRPPA